VPERNALESEKMIVPADSIIIYLYIIIIIIAIIAMNLV
jgi:hypothetical protein